MADRSDRPDDADDPARFPIAEVARQVGVPVATLRSWNNRYGIGPAGHRSGHHRTYTHADVEALIRLVRLIRAGVPTRGAVATVYGSVLVERSEALVEAAFDLDTPTVTSLLDVHLRARGVVATWERLCRPALTGVAARQSAGESCIDVEHLLSWCVMSALHRITTTGPGTGSIVLACTPGEHHTLPLEAVRAALAERDVAARMLGADVPADALRAALTRHATTGRALLWAQDESTGSTSAAQAGIDCGAKVFVAGPGWRHLAPPRGAVTVDSLGAAVTALLDP
ncbi:transposase-like protein [Nocardia transvalensis]|uniref:Transposase-like protein n=1 Tax=Nocardia transvalensis TaxID=37333 RepID=A0A7W9PMN6_9NOCA|nr:MerR family transcriptional regulator [Nocardia transvalensis]MBB5918308.1 transposase-like protein [Nocardia transvalensis]